MDDDLKPKRGEAKDLKEQFTECLDELVNQLLQLERIENSSAVNIGIYQPEIDKCVEHLLDAVSNTMIMDPH